MTPEHRRRKCLHCKRVFVPDCRNRERQKFCPDPQCQQASKQASQQAWLNKPENRDYFRGPENVGRVQQWRKAHPGYWKRSVRKPRPALQEACPAQPALPQEVANRPLPEPSKATLQDVCHLQTPLLVGLIAQFTQATLQEDIVVFTRALIGKGQDILDQPSRRLPENSYDTQTNPAPGTPAASPRAV